MARVRLPAISLWQPWASLWVAPGLKRHETRHWRYPARLQDQLLLVHAARKAEWPLIETPLDLLCAEAFGDNYRQTLPRGAFVGVVRLDDCVSTNSHVPESRHDLISGNWSPNRWGWRGIEERTFATPIAARGQQGLWSAEIDEGLLA